MKASCRHISAVKALLGLRKFGEWLPIKLQA
jgi:hypothetical protein